MIIGKKKKRYLMLIWNGLLGLKASGFAHNGLSKKKGLIIDHRLILKIKLDPDITWIIQPYLLFVTGFIYLYSTIFNPVYSQYFMDLL